MDASIKDFIKKTIEEIQAGLPAEYDISDEIKFDISLITTDNKKGGVNIKIASGEIDKEKQTIHNISFGVINPKKQQESMNQTASSIISYINQGFKVLTMMSAQQKVATNVVQEIKETSEGKTKKKTR